MIFHLWQSFGSISCYSLIETTPNGYGFNPELNVTTELKIFEEYWEMALQTSVVTEKAKILKWAADLYKGILLESAADKHWLIPKASYYNLRSQEIVVVR